MLAHSLSVFRCVWLAGRPGSGKTALSVKLALGLVSDGWARRIVSNIALVGVGRLLGRVDTMEQARAYEDSVLILDEAWQYLGRGVSVKEVRAWFAQIRHFNQFLILPSVLALTDQAKSFEVRRTLNLVSIGIPLWVYAWKIHSGSLKDQGRFFWIRPQSVFGLYNHLGTTIEGFYVYSFDESDQEIGGAAPPVSEGLGDGKSGVVCDRDPAIDCGLCGRLFRYPCTDLRLRLGESGAQSSDFGSSQNGGEYSDAFSDSDLYACAMSRAGSPAGDSPNHGRGSMAIDGFIND